MQEIGIDSKSTLDVPNIFTGTVCTVAVHDNINTAVIDGTCAYKHGYKKGTLLYYDSTNERFEKWCLGLLSTAMSSSSGEYECGVTLAKNLKARLGTSSNKLSIAAPIASTYTLQDVIYNNLNTNEGTINITSAPAFECVIGSIAFKKNTYPNYIVADDDCVDVSGNESLVRVKEIVSFGCIKEDNMPEYPTYSTLRSFIRAKLRTTTPSLMFYNEIFGN